MAKERLRGKENETIFRQWNMLRMIPRAPRKISTSVLRSRLEEHGYDVDVRTIQRDLHNLTLVFPLTCRDDTKPYGWSWAQDAELFDIPGMDTQAALAFHLLETYLARALPRSTVEGLEPHFRRAREVLGSLRGGLRAWPRKLRILPGTFELLPPKVDAEVIDAVYGALLENKRLRVQYRGRWDVRRKKFELNPLALVFRHHVPYLVCTIWKYQDVRELPLQRMSEAQVISEARTVPSGFVLDEHLRAGVFRSKKGPQRIRLKARFTERAGHHLAETRVSSDQELVDEDDGTLVVEGTVDYTAELIWWLRSFGPYVEILAPKKLRDEVADAARKTAHLYGRSHA